MVVWGRKEMEMVVMVVAGSRGRKGKRMEKKRKEERKRKGKRERRWPELGVSSPASWWPEAPAVMASGG